MEGGGGGHFMGFQGRAVRKGIQKFATTLQFKNCMHLLVDATVLLGANVPYLIAIDS